MGKYDPLRDHLASLTQDGPVTMGFADVGALVGGLPESARAHRAWWANDSKSEAVAWRSAGWHVESVNFTSERVVFARGAVGGSRLAGLSATPSRKPFARAEIAPEGRPEVVVQAQVVEFLRVKGWTIDRQADTATKERGIDVEASRDGVTLACEVKGYPSRGYADPRRAGEVKPTSPSVQARHWYSQAILTSMLTRHDHPNYEVVIVVPEAATYRALHDRTAESLARVDVRVWFVREDGSVDISS